MAPMKRLLLVLFLILAFSLCVFGQQPVCSANSNGILVHSEGLAEPLGDLTVTCTGGTAGATISLNLFISLNTNITNRLDSNGVPQGITITGATAQQLRLSGNTTLNIGALNYTVPLAPASPVTITVSGLRAAVAPLVTGATPATVTYSVVGIGANFSNSAGTVQAAISAPTLLSSLVNNGVPCNGSPLPSSIDFNSFTAANTNSSSLRVTEASNAAFTPATAGSDNGLRLLVNITGYGAGSRVFVPDVIAGNSATIPTSAGGFASTVSGGSYTPGSNQLLLIRVTGTDSNGAGGNLVTPKPSSAIALNNVSELTVTNGAAYAVYEVVDSNPGVQESAQIPVFVSVGSVNCPSTLTPQIAVQLAPISSVAVADQTSAIPRFVTVMPASDCTYIGDCTASYFPTLSVDTTPISLAASSKGGVQSAFIRVGNTGSGIVTFSTSVTYPSGAPAGWLTVTPATGSNNVTLTVIADPTNLDPGTYSATVNVNGGSYGMASVPVTFTVGPVGVTVQAVVNAASFTPGAVTPGSYVAIFGLNLTGTNVSVTFNGLPGTITYKSATQINAIVPDALAGQLAAAVIVTVDNKLSNTFRVNFAPNAIAIFSPGIVNVADGTVNSASSPAMRGSFISVYFTGLSLPVNGQVTANIGTQMNLTPTFAGPQGTFAALDQLNVQVPLTLPATPNPVKVAICLPNTLGQQACSNQVDLYIK